jgi:hypothetical protein
MSENEKFSKLHLDNFKKIISCAGEKEKEEETKTRTRRKEGLR